MPLRPWIRNVFACLAVVLLAGCQPKPQALPRYSAGMGAPPRSILVVPVVNTSTEVQAADVFLTTLAIPLVERGYYVFPTHMVKRTMEDDGLGDADLVHAADTKRLAEIFGADAVLYATVTDWNSRYIVLATNTSVAIRYDLRLGRTGETIWSEDMRYVHKAGPQSSGNPLADLIAGAIVAAVERASPSYLPLAIQANNQAILSQQSKLPPGPYYRAPQQ